MITKTKVMRDALIERINERMATNPDIFFVSADFGSPALDQLRSGHGDRFINVGIAEQNLINVSVGLALEGYTVYSYLIAPFVLRAYEQIRVSLAQLSQIRQLNVNIIGVGAGLSYDVTGPTHHCLEDIAIMRVLPNIEIFSPSDAVLAGKFIDYSLDKKIPKYIRLDGKPLPPIYDDEQEINIENGFFELKKGSEVCLVATGYMTGKALEIADKLAEKGSNAGVIDMFLLKNYNESTLYNILKRYKNIVTMEEAFIKKGGLDCLISDLLRKNHSSVRLDSLGFTDTYVFQVGDRRYLHQINGLSGESITKMIREIPENTRCGKN